MKMTFDIDFPEAAAPRTRGSKLLATVADIVADAEAGDFDVFVYARGNGATVFIVRPDANGTAARFRWMSHIPAWHRVGESDHE